MNLFLIIGVAVALFLIVFLAMGYLKAPPDVAYVISGLRKKPRILIGQAGIRIPFFERVDKLALGAIQIDVKTSSSVPTAEYINVKVDSNVNVRVGQTDEMLALACQNFLNVSRSEINQKVRDLLEGNVREIVGQMKLTEMVSDRKAFSEKVQENAVPDLARFGLELISFNVQNFTDDNDVIDNLGIDNVEQIRKKAAIAKSDAQREIAIAEAENAKTSNDGSSHVIDSGANLYPIQPDTTYYIKIGSNGTLTYFYISKTGYDNMTLVISGLSATSIPLTDLYIGSDPYFIAKGAFGGSIDLSETYIKVNDQLWWTAATNDIKHNQYLIPKVAKIINGNSFGNIVFDDNTGIVSGFSTTSGITLPETFPSTVSNFDMIFKGKISSFDDDDDMLIGYSDANEGGICIRYSSRHFSYWFDSWTEGNTVLDLNTYYWFRVIYNGSTTKGYLLLDNNYDLYNLPTLSQWSEEWTLANNKFDGRLLNLGYNFATTSEYWKGDIDLDNSVIKVNGSTWWTGTNFSTLYQLNCTKVGNPIFNQTTGVVSEFSSSNSLDISSSYGTIVGTYYAKFTTGSDITSFQNVLAPYPSFELYVENGALMSWLESEGHSITCGSVSQNTTYWAKIVLTNNTLTLSYSTDGITYTGDVTDSISYSSCDSFHIGTGVRSITSRYWRGSIDLSKTYIESNNGIVWIGATSNSKSISGCLYNYTDDGQQHNFDVYYDSNYTQPILVGSGEIYSQGTKVDTITIPEHKLWTYGNGGVFFFRNFN